MARQYKKKAKFDLVEVESIARRQYTEAKNYFDTNTKKVMEYQWNLYNGVRKKTPNAAGWRTNNFVPITFAAIQTEMARFLTGMIGPDGTDFYRLNPKMYNSAPSAQAISEVMNIHMQKGGFYQAMYAASLNAHIFGVGMIEQVWNSGSREFSYLKTSNGEVSEVDVTEQFDSPEWNAPSTMDVWWDPNAGPEKKKLTYVVKREFIRTSEFKAQIDKWNIQENYDYVLANNLSKSNELDSDPVIEMITVYTKTSITTLVYNKAVRYIKNPFANQQIPFYFIVRYPDFYRFGGKGIAGILSDLQEAQNDIYNLTLDNVKLSVNKVFLKRRDAYVAPQSLNIEPGKVISLEDVNQDLKMMDMGGVHMDAFNMLEKINGFVNQTTGSLDYINAPTGIGSQNKTAAGARIIVQEANRRFAMAIQYNKETFLQPMLTDLLSLYKQYIDRSLVGDLFEEGKLESLGVTTEQIQWDDEYNFQITGNNSLLDKQAVLENLQTALPMISQLGYEINTQAVIDQILDTLDLPKDLVLGVMQAPGAPPAQGANQQPPMGTGELSPSQPGAQAPPPESPGNPGAAGAQIDPQLANQITQIAQILGTQPEIIMQDLSDGKVTMPTLISMAQSEMKKRIGSNA